MINLKDVVSKYPECLENSEKFRNYLKDLYPERADQVRIKVLADAMTCGMQPAQNMEQKNDNAEFVVKFKKNP